MELPNLAGIATNDLVEKIGGGGFSASYINWSRTLHLLRENAPGWMVETVQAEDGSLVHKAPNGGYLLIRFRHISGDVTPAVPQAIMDNRNASIAFEKITARDITDTHRRGACLAAAMIFGLAYELWAKIQLESGYEHKDENKEPEHQPDIAKAAYQCLLDGIEKEDDLLVKETYHPLSEADKRAVWTMLNTKQKAKVRELLSKNGGVE